MTAADEVATGAEEGTAEEELLVMAFEELPLPLSISKLYAKTVNSAFWPTNASVPAPALTRYWLPSNPWSLIRYVKKSYTSPLKLLILDQSYPATFGS
ncbi:hypothetical protein KC335_g21 [Hortaea werneckii]|nr:hypothetical protein KC335_g21 [Hortaea werneckii]